MSIKYIFWDDNTGYGVSARQLIKALVNTGIQVLPVGLKQPSGHSAEYNLLEKTSQQSNYDIVFIHTSPYYIERCIEPGKVNIVYCTWETTRLPQRWVMEINRCNAVFVPSHFNKDSFEKSGVIRPIQVLPHISEFMGEGRLSQSNDKIKDEFTFYTIGMWTSRKNNFALMNAFTTAFSKDEKVRLIIKTSRKDYTKPAIGLFRKLGYVYYRNLRAVPQIKKKLLKDPRITLITQDWRAGEISDLHSTSHCFISLTKGEGWGIGAYEAAWYGNPIIITGFGGHLDFLNESFATLLPYDLKKTNDSVWTEYNQEEQEWAEVNITAGINAMKEVYYNQKEFHQKGKELRKYVSDQFNESRILESFTHDLITCIEKK